MFIITDEDMLKTDYEQKIESIMENHFSDFNPIEDIETLACEQNRCMIRTNKLTPTLLFMQKAGWCIRELQPDDEYVMGVRFE